MKKFITDIKTLAALLMAGAAFTACSSSDDNIIDEQPVNPAQKTYTLTVNASKGDGAQTRALDLTGKTLTASWATTENVYVKKGETWATGSLQPEADGTTATLKGSLTGITIEADDNLTLQFPKNGDITYAGQLGTLADIQANFDWATATVDVESVSPSGNINPKTATTTFTNQQAIIKFTLKDKANDAAISPSALTVTDGTSTVELTSIPDATYSTNGGAGVLYVAFPAAGSAKTITLTATVGTDTYTYETATAKTFTNGQYYEITVKMTKQAPPTLASEFFTTDKEITTYNGTHFTITCTNVGDEDGIQIGRNNTLTITAKGSETITKVEFRCEVGVYYVGQTTVTAGTLNWTGSSTTGSIDNVNATTVTMSNSNNGWITINQITVYYYE